MKLQLYDNTLRDGEQTIGVAYSKEDKLRIAKQLVKTGIRNIEVGFIVVSNDEKDSIKSIIEADLEANIFCLSRLDKQDVKEALKLGVKNITLFVPASDNLLRTKYKKSILEIKNNIINCIEYAKKNNMFVRFSCEDATQTPFERLVEFYLLAEQAGADYFSIPDTCGVGIPSSIGNLVKELKKNLKVPLSIHCHNDMNLATANSLAAFESGIDEIQVTVNGLGERVGNTSLDEVVMIMKKYFQLDLGINLLEMVKLAEMVSKISNINIPYNKPIIGKNAFRHESGLHVQAVLHGSKGVYEPFPPEWLGKKHQVAFGKHMGKSNIQYLCEKENIPLSSSHEKWLVNKIKNIAMIKRREISSDEVMKYVEEINKQGS